MDAYYDNTSTIVRIVVTAAVLVAVVAAVVVFIACRYKRCPANKLLVVYGNVGKNAGGTKRTLRCVHKGAAFIWPFVQKYAFFDLTPFSIDVDAKCLLTADGSRVDIAARFVVAISPRPADDAIERLLGLHPQQIREIAETVVFGYLRTTVFETADQTIAADRETFLQTLAAAVERQLDATGMRLVQFELRDINGDFLREKQRSDAAAAIEKAKRASTDGIENG